MDLRDEAVLDDCPCMLDKAIQAVDEGRKLG